ncbi:hypothetical protein RHOER0001_1268 [Rhodococcus erythropolis SK121]|nr:hypothetical protein RHOER0001_1268 [Rhodococcus erythropolis SK121]
MNAICGTEPYFAASKVVIIRMKEAGGEMNRCVGRSAGWRNGISGLSSVPSKGNSHRIRTRRVVESRHGEKVVDVPPSRESPEDDSRPV